MKLATLKDGSRDGQLAVVARDLKTAQLADAIAPTMRAALDDWAFIAPQLQELSTLLNNGRAARAFAFDPAQCMAPLPRASQRAAAYPRAALAGGPGDADKAALASPVELSDAPALQQCAADGMLGAQDAITLAHEAWGIDFDAQVAVICDDIGAGSTPDQAYGQIRLLMLLNEVSLRKLMPDELAGGGLLQSRPGAHCSPVAVTPDELDEHWRDAQLQLALRCSWNGKLVSPGQLRLPPFNYAQLLAHLCRTRSAGAGTVLSCAAEWDAQRGPGYYSIAAQRERELLSDGIASTPFLLFGDMIKIEILDSNSKSIFGAIEHTLHQAQLPPRR